MLSSPHKPTPEPLRESRERCLGRWARRISSYRAIGTIAATGRPCLLMTVASPRSARSSSAGSVLRASSAPFAAVLLISLIHLPYRAVRTPSTGFGSCRGTARRDPFGLRYVPAQRPRSAVQAIPAVSNPKHNLQTRPPDAMRSLYRPRVILRCSASSSTAASMIEPVAKPCQKISIRARLRKLRVSAMMMTPMMVRRILPWPP